MMRPIAAALLALALAGCGGDKAEKELGGKAQGQILPASVSDAMIPLDQVKSQAPLAPKSEGGDKQDAKAKETGPAAKAAADTPAEPAEPAAAEDAAAE